MSIPPNPLYGLIPPLLISLAFITPLLGMIVKDKRFLQLYACSIAVVTFLLSIVILGDIFAKNVVVYPFGGWPPPVGIAYEIDKLNAFLAFIASAIILASVISSTAYLNRYKASTISYLYTAIIGFATGVLGALYTGDIFNLFVMMEVLCISLYVMVSFHRTKAEAIEASIKYSLVSIVALVFYFLSTVLIYSAYQTLNMADLAIKSTLNTNLATLSGGYFGDIHVVTAIAMALIIWVFTLESALFPNHFWLPDAISEAPTPISAMIPVAEAVATYVIIRYLFTIFGPNTILSMNNVRNVMLYLLLILGIIASIVGSIMMALQRDAKRLLGYSSISHIGFIYTAIGLAAFASSPEAVELPLTAAIFHMVNYVISSSLLFLAVGAIEISAGSRIIDEITGLGKYAKVASISIVLGVFNLLGLPPLGGFFSKLMIYQAALASNQPLIFILVVIATAISVMGYAKLLLIPFGISRKEVKIRESLGFSIPSIVLAISTILLGLLLPIGLMDLLKNVAQAAYANSQYIAEFIKYMKSLWP